MSGKSVLSGFGVVAAAMTALASHCLFPVSGYSKVDLVGLYASGQYRSGVPMVGKWTIRSSDVSSPEVALKLADRIASKSRGSGGSRITLSSSGDEGLSNILYGYQNYEGRYVPSYGNSCGFAGALGYVADSGTRVEVEGTYENFRTNNPRPYGLRRSHEYFALVRPQGVTDTFRISRSDRHAIRGVIANPGIEVSSVVFSVCRDFASGSAYKIRPYVCGGVGGGVVRAMGFHDMGFIYQAKTGITVPVSRRLGFFIGGHYQGAMGSAYTGPVRVELSKSSASGGDLFGSTTVSYFGLEAGVRMVVS